MSDAKRSYTLSSRTNPKSEREFVAQGAYDTRNIFQSLVLAWTLLRIFPRELLHRMNLLLATLSVCRLTR